MTKREKAKLILEDLDEMINVNWDLEEKYLDVIENSLEKIDYHPDNIKWSDEENERMKKYAESKKNNRP